MKGFVKPSESWVHTPSLKIKADMQSPVYLLQRMPVGKWLAICLFGWSIATACTAAATSFNGLLAARIFGGIFEAGIPPSLMLISSQWYTKNEQILRFVWWYMGTAGGMVVGGFVSWCFQHVAKDAPLAGWRIMYVDSQTNLCSACWR